MLVIFHDRRHLGNHIAPALDLHPVADLQSHPLDPVRIVQRARLTFAPPTNTVFSIAVGVSFPLRPTVIMMSYICVIACSAQNL